MDWRKLVQTTSATALGARFRPGDEIRVWSRITEHGKERLSPFQGLVIRMRGSRGSETFTVRRISYGEGIERVFPIDCPAIARVEVLRRSKVKRSRLYFLRHVAAKTRLAVDDSASAAEEPGADKTAQSEKPEKAVATTNTSSSSKTPRA